MRFLMIVTIIISLAIPVGAQIDIGIMGGINVSEAYTGEIDLEKSPLLTYALGGLIDYPINEKWSLRIEPLYQTKGFRSKTPDALGWDFKYKAEYLEIPVLLRYRFDRGRLEPYVLAGPTLGYNIDCTYNSSSTEYSSDQDIQAYTESYDLGISLGAGVLFNFTHNALFIECRYAYGVKNTNIINDLNQVPWEINSRDFLIMAGIAFPFREQ